METGGAERVAAALCNSWAEGGNEVVLMPTFSGKGECHYQLAAGVKLDYLSDHVKEGPRLLRPFKRFMALRRAIREYNPHVVVSFLTHVNVVAILAGHRLAPVIVSERNFAAFDRVGFPWKILRRLTYRRARAVVAQTTVGAGWLNAHCPGARTCVIPNPVTWPLPKLPPSLQPGDVLAHDRKFVLAVGRLHEQKGFDHLIRIFADIVEYHSDWHLVIIGEGPERSTLENLRHSLGLDDRVHLPGRVGNLADWYGRATLYTLTSRFEGFPNTLIEAMSYGLPVVSMNCPTGPADIIIHGENGILVDSYDDLRLKLIDVMDASEERLRMGTEAINIRKTLSIKSISARWLDLFRRLAEADLRQDVDNSKIT